MNECEGKHYNTVNENTNVYDVDGHGQVWTVHVSQSLKAICTHLFA